MKGKREKKECIETRRTEAMGGVMRWVVSSRASSCRLTWIRSTGFSSCVSAAQSRGDSRSSCSATDWLMWSFNRSSASWELMPIIDGDGARA